MLLIIQSTAGRVTSYAEVWIEIGIAILKQKRRNVTSYAEVWIEIG